MKMVIPVDKFAAVANKYLVPAAIRKLEQEECKSEKENNLKESNLQLKQAL